MHTDKAWRKWAQEEPYFAVLTQDKYLSADLAQNLDEFFASGQQHVDRVLGNIEQHIPRPLNTGQALDFGCGVGRIAYPLANIFNAVNGVDIAEQMLLEAATNHKRSTNKHIQWILTQDMTKLVPNSQDLIHSALVFQHIAPKQGYQILSRLFGLLAQDGIFVLQVPFASNMSKLRQWYGLTKNIMPVLTDVIRKVRTRIARSPHNIAPMQMNIYDLNKIVTIAALNQADLQFSETSSADGLNFITLYFERRQK